MSKVALRPRSARSLAAVSVPGRITHCGRCRCKATVVEDGHAQAAPPKVANRLIQLSFKKDTGRPAQKQKTAKLHCRSRNDLTDVYELRGHTHEVLSETSIDACAKRKAALFLKKTESPQPPDTQYLIAERVQFQC